MKVTKPKRLMHLFSLMTLIVILAGCGAGKIFVLKAPGSEMHVTSVGFSEGTSTAIVPEEAREEFEHLAATDFADIPRDALWLTCMAYLCEVCAFLGDSSRAEFLYELLEPYAGRTVSVSAPSVADPHRIAIPRAIARSRATERMKSRTFRSMP